MYQKLESLGVDDLMIGSNRFNPIPARDRQTDGRTDRIAVSLSLSASKCYAHAQLYFATNVVAEKNT